MKFFYNDTEVTFDYVNNDPDHLLIDGEMVCAEDVEVELETIESVCVREREDKPHYYAFDFRDENDKEHTIWGEYKNGQLDLADNTICIDGEDWCLRIGKSEQIVFTTALHDYINACRVCDTEDRYEEYLIATRC